MRASDKKFRVHRVNEWGSKGAFVRALSLSVSVPDNDVKRCDVRTQCKIGSVLNQLQFSLKSLFVGILLDGAQDISSFTE